MFEAGHVINGIIKLQMEQGCKYVEQEAENS
jgi:hypothetical protein